MSGFNAIYTHLAIQLVKNWNESIYASFEVYSDLVFHFHQKCNVKSAKKDDNKMKINEKKCVCIVHGVYSSCCKDNCDWLE